MPIHDLGYRGWQGRLIPQIGRFWVIAQTGIRLAWRTAWVRRLLFMSWLPAVYFATLLLGYEEAVAHKEVGQRFLPWLHDIPISESRHQVWSCLLYVFFRYPQAVVMILVIGQVAPPLISQDVRTRAFLLYFSRPITRLEYVLGKMTVLGFYLTLISALPGLVLYVLAVLVSPELSVVLTTWDLPLRVLAASAVLMVPTAAVALAMSSLTSETRYATFGWFVVWVLGWATYALLRFNMVPPADPHRWSLVSLYHTLGNVQYWIFGLKHELAGRALSMATDIGLLPAPHQVQVGPAAVELAVVTLVALAIVFRRVSSPMRV